MKFSINQYAQSLHEVLQETHDNHLDQVIENFIRILKNNGDLYHYGQIISAYEELDRKHRGVVKGEITVANKKVVDAKLLTDLNKIAGKQVELTTKTDEDILGGVVIRLEDTLIDASIKTQIDNLKNSLAK